MDHPKYGRSGGLDDIYIIGTAVTSTPEGSHNMWKFLGVWGWGSWIFEKKHENIFENSSKCIANYDASVFAL